MGFNMVTVTQDFIDEMTANNLVAYNSKPSDYGGYDETELYDGYNVTRGSIVIKALTGFVIDEIAYRDWDGFVSNYEISENGHIATCNDIENFQNIISITVRALTPNVQGVNQVYELDSQGVSIISSKQFQFFTGQETLQYGDYLLGLIKLPFSIPSDLITSENETVKLGNFDVGITGKLINAETMAIDLGSIRVPLKFSNTLDFTNVTCVLYLPYCEPINIEHDFVIGETVSIQYIVNLYNGEMVVNISSSKTDGIIITKNIDLNIDVPFANVKSRPPKNDSRDIRLGVDNGVRAAQIVVMRNDALLVDGVFTIPITDEKTLNGAKGFVIIDEVALTGKANAQEKAEIISLLKSGVFIK